MLFQINSVAFRGLEAIGVTVEVDVASQGFPGVTIVGLPSKAVEEARERVKTAINNSGLDFPPKKITINLAPADLPKDGAAYDLPIALGILAASGQLGAEGQTLGLGKKLFYGELGLDGGLRETRGALPAAIYGERAKMEEIFLPVLCANEATVVKGLEVYPVRKLIELVDHLSGAKRIAVLKCPEWESYLDEETVETEMAQIGGQEQAKRALIIAAAGGHNLLMTGPPGAGKTMLAKAVPGILPGLTVEEALEVTRIYSVAGLLGAGQFLIRNRPFRSPHHGVSLAGMVGGGSNPRPGEVTLAHLGVLFLDEMAEFPRSVLEGLRQPMEDGKIRIARSLTQVEYPASFSLIAAVNPCPCGFLGHPRKECRCSSREIENYRQRISGPILDRIDLHVWVPPVEAKQLNSTNGGESSRELRKKVEQARQRQRERLKEAGRKQITNAQLSNQEIKAVGNISAEAERMLQLATVKYDLSARGYFKTMKVARTIADVDGAEEVKPQQMAEALIYRQQFFR